MSVFYCNICTKDYNNTDRKPLSLPCGDVFCEQCLFELYDKKNHILMCPSHKKEIKIEFNKIPIYSKILINSKNISSNDTKDIKDLSLYCIRHTKKKLKFFCENDRAFLCDNCLSQHNGHKYVEFKLNKDNFLYEINVLKNNFENIKCKYLTDKIKINKFISIIKNHIDEQISKINNYFNLLINIINDKKNKYILKINNISKDNLQKFEKLQNIFSISDEKYSFINNEFYYINNELLNKGEYETFYNLKNNFIQEIQNFENYININLFNNNNELIKNKIPIYIYPRNGFIEKDDELFGKFEDKTIEIDKSSINNSPRKNDKNNMVNNQNEKEKIIINNINNNDKENNNISLNNISNNNDSSLIDRKSNLNNNDSFIEKQLIETGFTFFLINNKNEVKNVFKQQDSEQSQNDLINLSNNINNSSIKNNKDNNYKSPIEQNKNNSNINLTKNSFVNNINNIKNNNNTNNNNIINNNKINSQNIKSNNYINQNNYQNNNYNYLNNIHSNNINQNSSQNIIQNINNNNINNILSNLNLNTSNTKKPYKLLNIINNNKEGNNYKKNKEKLNYHKISKNRDNKNNNRNILEKNNKEIGLKSSFYDKEKSTYLISHNNNSLEKNVRKNSHNFIKSEDNNKNKN